MRISDWSSDVCSSDLSIGDGAFGNALDPGPDSGHVLFQILGDEKFFQPANRIALLPALDFFLGAIRRCKEAFFGFDMSPPAIGTSLDERGPFARARPRNRLANAPPSGLDEIGRAAGRGRVSRYGG